MAAKLTYAVVALLAIGMVVWATAELSSIMMYTDWPQP